MKVYYLRSNSAIWELGPNGPWMLRDENNGANVPWQRDYIAQQFLRKEMPSIPLVEMHRFDGPDNKFNFTLMARAKGTTVAEIWPTLTIEQKTDIYEDLRRHIKQWRQITRPRMERVDGSELRDVFIGNCTGYGCIKTGGNEEEWLENLTPAIRKGFLRGMWMQRSGPYVNPAVRASWVKEADEKIDQLKANFPRCGPYVLTHGDLHQDNIFVSDENEEKRFKVTAIIDWELAGFFPWWAESWRMDAPGKDEILGDAADVAIPGYDVEDLAKINKAVVPVRKAWFSGGNHTISKHIPDQANSWYQQPFCACQPFAQEIRDTHLGLEEEHVDVFDIDSTDSEDDEEDDGWKKFPRHERQFLRWFNEVSNYKSQRTGSTPRSPL